MNRDFGVKIVRVLMVGVIGSVLSFSHLSAQPQRHARVRAGEQDWAFVGKAGNPRPGEWWTLLNLTLGKVLIYKDRSTGINLSWGDSRAATNVRLVPHPRDASEPIKTRRPIAIEIAGGGFLKYSERSSGINLVWSPEPVFEWEVRADGLMKRPIESGTAVGLYNSVVKKSLVYCPRDNGINLRWDVDCSEYDTSGRADIRMRVRIPFAVKCAGLLRVKFEPVAVASQGKRIPFTLDAVSENLPEYPQAAHLPPAPGVNANDWYCHRGLVAERLAMGVWRVSIQVPTWLPNPRYPERPRPWGVVCNMTLAATTADALPRAPMSNLRLLYDRQSCGLPNTYPR